MERTRLRCGGTALPQLGYALASHQRRSCCAVQGQENVRTRTLYTAREEWPIKCFSEPEFIGRTTPDDCARRLRHYAHFRSCRPCQHGRITGEVPNLCHSAHLRLDSSIGQANCRIAIVGDPLIVSHHHDCQTSLIIQLTKQIQNLNSRFAIKITRWLICQQ